MAPRQPKRGHRLRYGEGSFAWHDARQLWVGRLEAGTGPDGRRRRVEVSARDEDIAWDRLQVRRKTLMLEGAAAAMQKSITVKVWMKTWLAMTATELRPKSQRGNESYSRKWIVPLLGHRKLEDLGAADARRLVKAVLDAGRASTTAAKILETFQAALKRARADGYMVPEPVLMARKPAAAVQKRAAIPLEDALPLVEHIASRPDGARWVAALLQGMRPGECMGLTWDAIDWQAGTIDVSWQLQQLPYLDRKAGTFKVPHGYESRQLWRSMHLVRPKTNAGQRVIPMVPWLRESLLRWRDVAPVSPYGLVWPRPDGRPCPDDVDRAAWYALQEAAGISKADGSPYVLYEARHTAATLLLMAGVDPTVIKEIMGHSDVVMQRAYLHAPKALLLAALEKVAGTLQLPAP